MDTGIGGTIVRVDNENILKLYSVSFGCTIL